MKGHAIIGFNHGVLGLAENPALGPGFFRQNTSGYALGVLTTKASLRAGFSAKPSTPWLKPIVRHSELYHWNLNEYGKVWTGEIIFLGNAFKKAVGLSRL